MTDVYLVMLHKVFKVFRVCGMYRPKGTHFILMVIAVFLRWFINDFSLLLQVVEFSHADNIFDIADFLSMTSITFLVVVKCYIMSYKFEDIQKLSVWLSELLKFASYNRSDFGQHVKKRINFIKNIYLVYYITGMASIASSAFLNIILSSEPYQLFFKIYIPTAFDCEHNFKHFVLFMIYQFFTMIFGTTALYSIDFMTNYFFGLGAGLLEELADRLSAIEIEIDVETRTKLLKEKNFIQVMEFEMNHEKKTVEELKYCIEIHTRIKEYFVNVQNIASPMIFVQVICNTTIICMTCYTLSMVSSAFQFSQVSKLRIFSYDSRYL